MTSSNMKFVKGAVLGRGSFATVHLAVAGEDRRRIIAVKSAAVSQAASLLREADILSRLQGFPEIVACYGHGVTVEKGMEFYNIFMEYVAGGTLSDYIRAAGGRLQERAVARLARSASRGLCFIHAAGYVHCDIKPQNLLVTPSLEVKIADFGLAKAAGETSPAELRGTPLYMSPEAVARGEHEAPGDVWALGCVVAELFSGKPAWVAGDVGGLLFRIGFGGDAPGIPSQASEQGRDFIARCLERDPSKRWTAEMLLTHPFLAGEDGDDRKMEDATANPPSYSPKGVLDLSSGFSWGTESVAVVAQTTELERIRSCSSPSDRIRELASEGDPPSWFPSSSDDWVSAWESDSDISQTCGDDPESALDVMVAGNGRRSDQAGVIELESIGSHACLSTANDSIPAIPSGNEHRYCLSDDLFSDHDFPIGETTRSSSSSRTTTKRLRLIDSRCSETEKCNDYDQHVRNGHLFPYNYKFNSCLIYLLLATFFETTHDKDVTHTSYNGVFITTQHMGKKNPSKK